MAKNAKRPTAEAAWTVLHNSDSHIIRWRNCLADGVVKIQCWSTNPGYGDKGIVTLDVSGDNLRRIVAALPAPSKRRASASGRSSA